MKTLTDIIAYNTAHADEALKFGQTILVSAEARDLNDPAQNATYVTARDTQRSAAQVAIDNALTRGTPDPADDVESIMTPAGTLTGIGARAGYPQIVVPAGYDGTRRPVGIAFNGTAYSEAKQLAFAYAYEQATNLRKTPSEINPAVWRCYAGAPRSCPPGRDLLGDRRHAADAAVPDRDRHGRRPPGPHDRRHAERGHADQGLPAPDRAHEHRGPGDPAPCGRSTRRRSPMPRGWTPSAPPGTSAARCTASP